SFITTQRHGGAERKMENFTALFRAQADPPPPPTARLRTRKASTPASASSGVGGGPCTARDKSVAGCGPFYLIRELPGSTELTGSTNLITHYNLEHAYNKFCGKKVKEKLSNFLPDLPGMIDLPGSHDNSSLRSFIEKPPILSGSFNPITGTRLQCRLMHIHRTQDPVPPKTPSDSDHKKKKKKKEEDAERKRKKKEKKKKNRHSPDHPGMGSSQASSSSSLC
uniref:Mediator of RNA polymerase II transcription subunit 19 n=1 Tax=Propithecus coquereli TaxID=379532 RepID=A0A2K6G3A7_PROCO